MVDLKKIRDQPGLKNQFSCRRRNPSDAKIYSNRAACYTKLRSFDLSLKDCEKAIELDPKFIRAYLHKANAQKGQSVGECSLLPAGQGQVCGVGGCMHDSCMPPLI